MTQHFRDLSTDPKVTTDIYNIINNTKAKYCSKAFIKRSQHTILSRDSKGRTTLHSIMKVPQESTAQQFAFEWLNLRISFTDPKVRTNLYSTTAKYCSAAFIWMKSWSVNFRISSTVSKVRITLYSTIKGSTTRMFYSVCIAFNWMVIPQDSVHKNNNNTNIASLRDCVTLI